MAHYDDPNYLYTDYWHGRDYEHQSELIALNRLIGHNSFSAVADIGGGYGRLTSFLANLSQQTYLIEPSAKLRKIATEKLKNNKSIKIISGLSHKVPLPAKSLDLIMFVRVFHHLPDLKPTFTEISRVLKPGGYLLLEFANSTNFKTQLQALLHGYNISESPVDRRSAKNRNAHTIDFVNHHPATIDKFLSQNNFQIIQTLSVSNFRSPIFKKVFPLSLLKVLEWGSQILLSKVYFGPSIFVLAQKK